MNVQIFSDSDPGLARANNEDSVAFDAESGLCILADGMGGHNAGEVASGMATAFIKSEMMRLLAAAGKQRKAEQIVHAIEHCVTQSNHAIHTMAGANPLYAGMGTTLVLGVFHNDKLVLGHIGDSRCYRLRDGQLQQITKDHSVHQEQLDAGLYEEGSAFPPTFQNLLTRGLGTSPYVSAEINVHKTAADDIYLMCSDGLTDMVSDEEIAAVLAASDSLPDMAQRLIAAANDGGGRDNISVVLARVNDVWQKNKLLGSARRALGSALSGLRRDK